ncbi:MAG: hypothetical protein ACYDAK_04460 [Candidatus Limnocylindrales bacterium]
MCFTMGRIVGEWREFVKSRVRRGVLMGGAVMWTASGAVAFRRCVTCHLAWRSEARAIVMDSDGAAVMLD